MTGLIVGRHVCFTAFEDLYLGGTLGDSTYKGIEGLWVTTSGNERLTNKKGGVQELQCRWGSTGTGFGCWLYDTDEPEGSLDDHDLEGDGEPNDPAYTTVMECPDNAKTCREEDKIPKRKKFRSPLAAPFVSFTHSSKRFAVFPESFTGGTVTLFKHVPTGEKVRAYSAASWHDDVYDIGGDGNSNDSGDVLKVQDTTSLIRIGLDSVHPWVDVAASDFKAAIRRRYPCTGPADECSP